MKKLFVILVAMLLLLSACGGQQGDGGRSDTAPPAENGGAVEEGAASSDGGLSTQILFNGSSTLAPVIQAIALEFNEAYGSWDGVDAAFPAASIDIYVASGGSGQGAKARIEGTADYGMLARTLKDTERESIDDCREYLVGIDALTLGVHPDNPVNGITDDLTTAQIVAIFSGEYATWSDLDPSLPGEEIVVITRDIGGGAHEVFQNVIMGDVDVKADAIQAPSMGALVARIIENPYAIGYASFGVANQNAGSVVMLKVDGVDASVANIQSGDYVIQRPLLLIGSGEPTALEQSFLDVVLGAEGQAIVEEMGFVPAG